MNPVALIGLVKDYWQLIAIAALVCWGQYWHHEAKDVRAEFAVYKAEVAAKIADRRALDLQADKEDLIYHDKLDREHAAKITALGTALSSVVGELRVAQTQRNSGRGGAAQPVSIPADFCDKSDAVRRLRDALQAAERRIGDAITGYQIGIAEQIIGPAARREADFDEVKTWALRGREANAPKPAK